MCEFEEVVPKSCAVLQLLFQLIFQMFFMKLSCSARTFCSLVHFFIAKRLSNNLLSFTCVNLKKLSQNLVLSRYLMTRFCKNVPMFNLLPKMFFMNLFCSIHVCFSVVHFCFLFSGKNTKYF